MLSLGHAGVYHVGGNINRPKYHIAQGGFLGDVGWLNERGSFSYCFNIFYPPDHPIQYTKGRVPQNFRPFEPPLSPVDVRTHPNYLPPGAILCTEGVRYSQSSASPLKAEFIVNAQEGAVLVLPDGATREELVNPSAIHAYVNEHAVTWYQLFNGDNDGTTENPVANGTLLVVTSVVRAKSWVMAIFPFQGNNVVQYAKNVRFKYDAEAIRYPWEQITKWHPINYQYERAAEGEVGAVLLGGLSMALSPSLWSNNVAYILLDSVQSCPVLLVPPMGLNERLQRITNYMRGAIEPPILDDSQGHFHPSPIILQILLLSNPAASMGVVDDSIWVPHLNKRVLTHPEFVG
ncbi:hypothetical protein BDN70DRAFT_997415 [Pholiota conissans]|uniref:Uncharacterized protein n=1 Tax=Pholiota conissans TaxID=109636 RepID=A0A9P5YSL1_9AGAR|nr:hypothetical protein BDN70DRAFT_997415 [Pholiota conissans]